MISSCRIKKIFLTSVVVHRRMSSVVVRSVVGLEDRVNDVVTPVMKRDQYDEVVVYFGGDVQDLEENMIKHRDNSRYREWSLENTCLLLQQVHLEIHTIEYVTFFRI